MGLLSNPITKKISRVKVLGVRTAEETKVIATWNSTIYCLLVEYTNGDRSLIECNSKEMSDYLYYIDMDY